MIDHAPARVGAASICLAACIVLCGVTVAAAGDLPDKTELVIYAAGDAEYLGTQSIEIVQHGEDYAVRLAHGDKTSVVRFSGEPDRGTVLDGADGRQAFVLELAGNGSDRVLLIGSCSLIEQLKERAGSRGIAARAEIDPETRIGLFRVSWQEWEKLRSKE